MAKLIPYVRQSRKKEKTISPESQRETIKRWLNYQDDGDTLLTEVFEPGISGSKDWKTRELGAAITAVEEGLADGIIVAYQSRLSRESGLGTAEVWEHCRDSHVRIVIVDERIDTDIPDPTGDQEFVYNMNAAIARKEWRRHQANWAKADDHCAEEGIVQSGVPVGYSRADGLAWGEAGAMSSKVKDARLVKNEDAPHVKRAFEAKAAGKSYAYVASLLEDAGVKTPTGLDRWGTTSVATMLRKTVYKGIVSGVFHEHLVIVSEPVWEAAQMADTGARKGGVPVKLSYDPARGIVRTKGEPLKRTGGKGRTDGGRQVLGGLVKCQGCGRTASANPTAGGKYHYFKCPKRKRGEYGCPAPLNVRADVLTEYVIREAFEEFLSSVPEEGLGVGQAADDATLNALADELRKAEAQKAELVEAIRDGRTVDAEFVTAASDRIARVTAALEAERGKRVTVLSPAEIRAVFEKATIEEKRDLARRYISSVLVARKGVAWTDVEGVEHEGSDDVAERAEVLWKTEGWVPERDRR